MFKYQYLISVYYLPPVDLIPNLVTRTLAHCIMHLNYLLYSKSNTKSLKKELINISFENQSDARLGSQLASPLPHQPADWSLHSGWYSWLVFGSCSPQSSSPDAQDLLRLPFRSNSESLWIM